MIVRFFPSSALLLPAFPFLLPVTSVFVFVVFCVVCFAFVCGSSVSFLFLLCFSCVVLFWVFSFVSYLSWGLLVYFVVVVGGFFLFVCFVCVCVCVCVIF